MKKVLIGLSLTTIVLIMLESVYAGVLGNLWYFVNIVFWLLCVLVFYLGKNSSELKRKITAICVLIVGVILGFLFVLHIPDYTYNEAIKNIQANVPETQKYTALHSRKYWNLVWDYETSRVPHSDYLIVFDSAPLQAFYFDPYRGNFALFDIATEFPYLVTNAYASAQLSSYLRR